MFEISYQKQAHIYLILFILRPQRVESRNGFQNGILQRPYNFDMGLGL